MSYAKPRFEGNTSIPEEVLARAPKADQSNRVRAGSAVGETVEAIAAARAIVNAGVPLPAPIKEGLLSKALAKVLRPKP